MTGRSSAPRDAVGPLTVSERGLRAAVPTGTPLDVLFDGRRIWSLSIPTRMADASGMATIAWPDPLLPHLHGAVDIEIREHDTSRLVARSEVTLGTGTGRVTVADAEGRLLAMQKWGKLGRVFEDVTAAEKRAYLDQVDELLGILRDVCEVPAFLSYGTLLGAVRDGRLIGHDVDVDLGYLSRHTAPVDVMRESFAIERAVSERTGWRTARANGGFLQFFPSQPDGSTRNIDVFSCFTTETGRLYQINDIGTKGDRSCVEPLGSVSLEGRRFPSPARPEVFLEAAYGKGWRVPDPTFQYRANPTRRRIRMWVGGLREDRDRWTRFYRAHLDEIPTHPSPFGEWVATQLAEEAVVDIGCGNGRDVMHLARNGHRVTGLDIAPSAYRAAQTQARNESLDVDFRRVNLSSLRDVLLTGADVAAAPGPRAVLGRFVLHGLTSDGRDAFWRLTRMVLHEGGRAFVECRVPPGPSDTLHFDWPKGPRGLDVGTAVHEAEGHGGRVIDQVVARGLAPFHEEDPMVCRMTVEFPPLTRRRRERPG